MKTKATRRLERASRPVPTNADREEWRERSAVLYEELRLPALGLMRRAYGSGLGAHEMEDAYSSAWVGTLRALEGRHTEMSDEEIRSYVLTAVANQAGKEVRRRRRKPVAPLEAARSVAEVADSPEDAAAIHEKSAVTRDVLSSLPPRRRAVMLLRYGWGLDPSEVCDRVHGLSARAYRKEIAKGVDALTERIRLVEDGGWCEEREALLKTFAAGEATDDQALQARHHLSHCRSCTEFVGKLTGHLHDVGSVLVIPGAIDGMDGHVGMFARFREAADSAKDAAVGVFSRSDPAEAATALSGGRGAGAVGAGVIAKVSGMSGGGKAALTCLGGGLAATACVATGIATFNLDGLGMGGPDRKLDNPVRVDRSEIRDLRDQITVQTGQASPGAEQVGPDGSGRQESDEEADAAEQPVVDESTPPTTAEFGAESVASPATAPPTQTDAGTGSGAVAEEFGP